MQLQVTDTAFQLKGLVYAKVFITFHYQYDTESFVLNVSQYIIRSAYAYDVF